MNVLRGILSAELGLSGLSKNQKIFCIANDGFRTCIRLSSSDTESYPKDNKIILHQFVQGRCAPSLSPFPMKVETYLRINKIPFQNEFSKPLGPKGKSPWMTYNEEDIADSHFILEFLNKKFNIDMNSHLNASEKAIAKSFKHMLEDHLYWTAVYHRWVREKGQAVIDMTGWPNTLKGKIMFAFARRRLIKQCWGQGMGRHSQEQISRMAYDSVKALSAFLDSKDYLMGDKICEEDCSIFGFVVQVIYNTHGDEEQSALLLKECPNLSKYCERIKSEYWPDWDSCIRRKSKTL